MDNTESRVDIIANEIRAYGIHNFDLELLVKSEDGSQVDIIVKIPANDIVSPLLQSIASDDRISNGQRVLIIDINMLCENGVCKATNNPKPLLARSKPVSEILANSRNNLQTQGVFGNNRQTGFGTKLQGFPTLEEINKAVNDNIQYPIAQNNKGNVQQEMNRNIMAMNNIPQQSINNMNNIPQQSINNMNNIPQQSMNNMNNIPQQSMNNIPQQSMNNMRPISKEGSMLPSSSSNKRNVPLLISHFVLASGVVFDRLESLPRSYNSTEKYALVLNDGVYNYLNGKWKRIEVKAQSLFYEVVGKRFFKIIPLGNIIHDVNKDSIEEFKHPVEDGDMILDGNSGQIYIHVGSKWHFDPRCNIKSNVAVTSKTLRCTSSCVIPLGVSTVFVGSEDTSKKSIINLTLPGSEGFKMYDSDAGLITECDPIKIINLGSGTINIKCTQGDIMLGKARTLGKGDFITMHCSSNEWIGTL